MSRCVLAELLKDSVVCRRDETPRDQRVENGQEDGARVNGWLDPITFETFIHYTLPV
jgi:hypothetical protein